MLHAARRAPPRREKRWEATGPEPRRTGVGWGGVGGRPEASRPSPVFLCVTHREADRRKEPRHRLSGRFLPVRRGAPAPERRAPPAPISRPLDEF